MTVPSLQWNKSTKPWKGHEIQSHRCSGPEWLIGRNGTIPSGPLWLLGREGWCSIIIFIYLFILGWCSVMAVSRYYVCSVTAVPGSSFLSFFFLFFVHMQPDVTRLFTPHTVSGVVAWLQPQKCKSVCKMENKKSKGGAETARIKKRTTLVIGCSQMCKNLQLFQ